MISIIKHIEKVELSFDKEKIISSLTHINSSHEPLALDVPLDIKYNENWTVAHACECDNKSVSFSKNNKQNWNLLNKLFSRFYKREMLEKIAEAFDSLHVFESEKSKFAFLTKSDFNDPNAAIYAIPQVNFNRYQCKKCYKEYLCRMSEGIAREPDRDIPDGMPGKLMIHEIVHFEFTTNNVFYDYFKNP